MHLCACGCKTEISTPLHPTGWKITFNGESVSLYPSVGNWSERCQSHYVIRDNQVIWGYRFSKERINDIRKKRREDIARHYRQKQVTTGLALNPSSDSGGIWGEIPADCFDASNRRYSTPSHTNLAAVYRSLANRRLMPSRTFWSVTLGSIRLISSSMRCLKSFSTL